MPINSFSPPRIVIDTNSPAHAESSPHVRRTLDINRESDIHAVAGTPQTPISIHALRKESDPGTLRLTKRSKNFNPHSPCEERLKPDLSVLKDMQFQSTLPLRGATPSNAVNNASSDFNPHSPCGERQTDHETDVDEDEFQSTLPLRGATRALSNPLRFRVFQSTLPLRGATIWVRFLDGIREISIHTPLAGSDRQCKVHRQRRAISIHTPLAGSDDSPHCYS